MIHNYGVSFSSIYFCLPLLVCPSALHKNFNLAHNFQTPSCISTTFGGKVYPKEIYSPSSFKSDPMKTVANCFLWKFSGFEISYYKLNLLPDFY